MINREDLYLEEIEFLRRRLGHLESANQQLLGALELLREVRELAEAAEPGEAVFESLRGRLRRLLPLGACAYLTVREDDASFQLVSCDPPQAASDLQAEVDRQVEDGMFAWALNQHQALVVRGRHLSGDVLLHVLATPRRVRGMFLARLQRPAEDLRESALTVLSLILNHLAHHIESRSLYALLEEQRSRLEALTQDRSLALAREGRLDPLTGLPNRGQFTQRLGEALRETDKGRPRSLALILFDLDKFKRVNDSLGYRAGDVLLEEFARRLQSQLRDLQRSPREAATAARLGADEFAVLLPGVADPESVSAITQELIHRLARPYRLDDNEIHLSVSGGISLAPHDGRDAEELLRNADAAMRTAKHKGRNLHQFYTRDMNRLAARHLRLENQLHRAVERGEFELHFQPQVALPEGRIVGAEALLRWRHPEEGLVLPGQFIGLAEESGLMGRIGAWAFAEACRRLAGWQRAGIAPERIAVNLSPCQLQHEGLIEELRGAIAASGVDPGGIELEITENALAQDATRIQHNLQALRGLGLRLAIDDFGTGYSSFAQLKRLKVDTLKVDRSFVQELPADRDNAAIVQAVVAMAHGLGLELVAEGVENEAQLAFLRALGCRRVQGFLFHRPLPAEDFTELLRGQR